MGSRIACIVLLVTGLISTVGVPVASAELPIDKFIGTFVGRSISVVGEGLSQRDLNVAIKRYREKGFTLDWTTVTRKPDGSAKSKSYSINFLPTKRNSLYQSAMRNNVFGGVEPLDPLKGDPYVWASLSGDTLTVYALLITDEGGYEMQVYERTLTDDGMSLRFSRNRDGERLRFITGTLQRTSN